MPRFATPRRSQHSFVPRLDPIGPQRRLDAEAPLVAAYLGSRPVVLARPDPRTRRPGMPADLTVPLTLSRFRRALDIERDRATGPFDPSLVDDWPITHLPIGAIDWKPIVGKTAAAVAAFALALYLFS